MTPSRDIVDQSNRIEAGGVAVSGPGVHLKILGELLEAKAETSASGTVDDGFILATHGCAHLRIKTGRLKTTGAILEVFSH